MAQTQIARAQRHAGRGSGSVMRYRWLDALAAAEIKAVAESDCKPPTISGLLASEREVDDARSWRP